tara:strand:- start:1059 stop:2384 length:1326 start_codon:yes stop_codon:yes gene_type:complete
MVQKKIDIKNIVDEKKLKFFFDRLFKIPRSITGKGFLKSIKILGEIVDLNLVKIKSGSKVLDWTVPKEWNVNDAYVLNSKGEKIIDFKKNNLHLVNYSIPIKKKIEFNDLNKHLFKIKSMPNAIPYVTSYYNRNWGFCLSYNQYKKINKKDKFKVVIDTKLHNGNLIYSDKKIKGKSKKEILIYTYLCHPQMANNELSGPLVWSFLYKYLKMTGPHNYTYRFVCAPENIGAASFLHKNKKNVKNIVAGYIVQCAGNGKIVTFKKSRLATSLADRAALNIIKNSKFKYKIVDFVPDGSDERQFCSPGFNLPIASIMRKMYGEYKEYHTSLDNEKCISYKTILETLNIYIDTLKTIEGNFVPYARVQYGTPQLSKSKIDLYPKMMNFIDKPRKEYVLLMLEILNLSDGKLDLLDICNIKGFKLINYIDLYEKLIKSKHIKIKK